MRKKSVLPVNRNKKTFADKWNSLLLPVLVSIVVFNAQYLEQTWCTWLISRRCFHVLSEVLSDPAVTARLADVKASGEVKSLDDFYQMLQNDPDRAFYGWDLLIFLFVIKLSLDLINRLFFYHFAVGACTFFFLSMRWGWGVGGGGSNIYTNLVLIRFTFPKCSGMLFLFGWWLFFFFFIHLSTFIQFKSQWTFDWYLTTNNGKALQSIHW